MSAISHWQEKGATATVAYVAAVAFISSTPLHSGMPITVLDPHHLSTCERTRLQECRNVFVAAVAATATMRLIVHPRGGADEEVALPRPVAQALAVALTALADGQAVQIAPVDEEVTTSEAAELLNVSRPYLVRLLDEGAIPHRRVGTHRRVRRADVVAYREWQYREANSSLQALADQALGSE